MFKRESISTGIGLYTILGSRFAMKVSLKTRSWFLKFGKPSGKLLLLRGGGEKAAPGIVFSRALVKVAQLGPQFRIRELRAMVLTLSGCLTTSRAGSI